MDTLPSLRAVVPAAELHLAARRLLGQATTELVALVPAEHPVAVGLGATLHELGTGDVLVRVVHDGGSAPPFPGNVLVRTVERVPQVIVVADRSVALLSSREPRTPPTIVGESVVVQACATAFAGMWAHSREATAIERERLCDRAVLHALGCGTTDECAARELNISTRTYRRRVAELMEQLGASSRFQAGMLAAGRGWAAEGRGR